MKDAYEYAADADYWLGLAVENQIHAEARQALAAIGHGYASLAIAGELRAIRELLTGGGRQGD